ncbi:MULTISPECIES: MarR family winged helix-turn-helix transcriptional regulator [unclassified Janibacter]|uniref:MarR family winged helix-turn-helix transcriptional regulator n=1 Tax=unclassified Janibacter TaxID=2649294 RepID=UPI003CFDAD70
MSGDDARWLTTEQQNHWRAYLRGSRLLEVALDDELAPFKTQITEYELLSMLSESPGGRSRMAQLADAIVQSRSRVTHTASRLERRGWVRREACADDRRGIELVLTDAGREALLRMAPAHVGSVRQHLVDVLSDEEFAALGRAMAIVRDSLRPEHHEIRAAD